MRGANPLEHLRISATEGNVVASSVVRDAIAYVDALLRGDGSAEGILEAVRARDATEVVLPLFDGGQPDAT